MNHYFIINKIIQYLYYDDFKNTIKVSKLWRHISINNIFSIPCNYCHKNYHRIWSGPFFSIYPIFISCDKCDIENQFFNPVIPLIPGDTIDYWKTSDIPLIWKTLWFFIDLHL